MPTIPLHLPPRTPPPPSPNPLPQLLHTPSGLAILEIQGTLNLPPTPSPSTIIGRLVFPHYDPDDVTRSNKAWQKTVYLYVGRHQRMTGEVRKLGRPIAVVGRRGEGMIERGEMEGGEELEVVQIVYWKVIFSSRPEPVG